LWSVSPYINRFLQPDTVIPAPSNPQSWNRYSYVTNRPINFNDPSGHRQCEDYGDGICLSEDQMTSIWAGDGEERQERSELLALQRKVRNSKKQACGGPNPSVVCLTPPAVELPPSYVCPSSMCTTTPSTSSSSFDAFFDYLDFANNFNNVLDYVEDGIQFGRPAYRQVKYAISLGGLEYGIDAGLQLYDDRNKDLTFTQRILRAGVRAGESALIDAASQIVGGAAGAALQASVPVPFVSAGVGYIVGSYSTSAILDNGAAQLNESIFTNYLGGP